MKQNFAITLSPPTILVELLLLGEITPRKIFVVCFLNLAVRFIEENKYGKVSHLGNVASEEKKETEKITDLAEAKVAHSPSPSAMKQSDPH